MMKTKKINKRTASTKQQSSISSIFNCTDTLIEQITNFSCNIMDIYLVSNINNSVNLSILEDLKTSYIQNDPNNIIPQTESYYLNSIEDLIDQNIKGKLYKPKEKSNIILNNAIDNYYLLSNNLNEKISILNNKIVNKEKKNIGNERRLIKLGKKEIFGRNNSNENKHKASLSNKFDVKDNDTNSNGDRSSVRNSSNNNKYRPLNTSINNDYNTIDNNRIVIKNDKRIIKCVNKNSNTLHLNNGGIGNGSSFRAGSPNSEAQNTSKNNAENKKNNRHISIGSIKGNNNDKSPSKSPGKINTEKATIRIRGSDKSPIKNIDKNKTNNNITNNMNIKQTIKNNNNNKNYIPVLKKQNNNKIQIRDVPKHPKASSPKPSSPTEMHNEMKGAYIKKTVKNQSLAFGVPRNNILNCESPKVPNNDDKQINATNININTNINNNINSKFIYNGIHTKKIVNYNGTINKKTNINNTLNNNKQNNTNIYNNIPVYSNNYTNINKARNGYRKSRNDINNKNKNIKNMLNKSYDEILPKEKRNINKGYHYANKKVSDNNIKTLNNKNINRKNNMNININNLNKTINHKERKESDSKDKLNKSFDDISLKSNLYDEDIFEIIDNSKIVIPKDSGNYDNRKSFQSFKLLFCQNNNVGNNKVDKGEKIITNFDEGNKASNNFLNDNCSFSKIPYDRFSFKIK